MTPEDLYNHPDYPRAEMNRLCVVFGSAVVRVAFDADGKPTFRVVDQTKIRVTDRSQDGQPSRIEMEEEA
jgi:hypothetical protein